jgi:hypothetical protein
MNRTTFHHAARMTAAIALGAGLGSAGIGLDRSLAAAPASFGFFFEADRCEDTYGSAPTGEWFPISSYRSSTSSGFGTCIFPFEADSYVRWVAPANGTMRAYACSGGDISPDWVLQASHGCGADSSSLACGYQSPSEELPGQCYGGAGISIEVEAGTAYYLRVAGAFQEIPADYGLSMLIEFEERHSILGDLNFDGRVNGLDLGLLFANWTG